MGDQHLHADEKTNGGRLGRLGSVSHDVAAHDLAVAPDYVTENAIGRNSGEQPKSIGMWEAWKQWPKCVFCIVGNEFCERFNYYGMRAVLIFYLLYLKFDEDNATALYHGFTVVAYFTPWMGAYLADGILGKFRVIMFISLVYAAGSVMLAAAAMQDRDSHLHPCVLRGVAVWLDLAGLVTIAIGTGGIKPCVAPFGADQFDKGQEDLIGPYFGFFYASINAGSLISINLSPILASTPCLGQATCYPLAFGIPAVLMVVAVALFVFGSRWYKKPPPSHNIFNDVAGAMKQALVNKHYFSIKRDHWLDHVMDSHSCAYDDRCIALQRNEKTATKCHKKQLVEDIKGLLRVCIMLLPVPLFWTLYDQQGSRWLIQTSEMNYKLGGWTMPPALVQAINPILILTFIPLFQTLVYPLSRKLGINPTPLRRMVVGGFVAAGAFVIAGFLQLRIHSTLPSRPEVGMIHLGFMNTLPCNLTIRTPMYKDGNEFIHVMAESSYEHYKEHLINGFLEQLDAKNVKDHNVIVEYDDHPLCVSRFSKYGGGVNRTVTIPLRTADNKTISTMMVYTLTFGNVDGGVLLHESTLQKSNSGLGDFLIKVVDLRDTDIYRTEKMYGNASKDQLLFCYNGIDEREDGRPCHPTDVSNFAISTVVTKSTDKFYRTSEDFNAILPDSNEWMFFYGDDPTYDYDNTLAKTVEDKVHQLSNASFTIDGQGGIWMVGIYDNTFYGKGMDPRNNTERQSSAKLVKYQLVSNNDVPIYWQIPQFAVITAAEILVSITGLEFSYSQAAPSMKSILQAVWLTTISIGDFIILIVAERRLFADLYKELFFFAALMCVVNVVFMLIAQFYYTYNYHAQGDDDDDDTDADAGEVKKSNGI